MTTVEDYLGELTASTKLLLACESWASEAFGRGFVLERQNARVTVALLDRGMRVAEFHATTDAEAFDGWTVDAVRARIVARCKR